MTDAWLAGFIDGEGCLSAFETKRYGKLKGYPDFKAVCIIANTHHPTIEAIQAYAGGRVYHKKSTGNQREIHQLHWGPRELRVMLPRLIPHLITKRKQAEAMMVFLKTRGPEAKRAQLQLFRDLNHRGI